MAQLLTGSICLTDIPKDKITTSEKNGKKYLNIAIWVNDEKDTYGNDGSIQVQQTKDEREAKAPRTYIGNVRKPAPAAEQPAHPAGAVAAAPVTDDLPF
jgi:hypothetical protein